MTKTPMQKMEAALNQYLESNTSPFISPTVLHTVLELSQKLQIEETALLKRSFKMGTTVKPNVDPEEASSKFISNNFIAAPVRSITSKKQNYE